MVRRFEAVVQRAADSTELKKHTDGRTVYKAVATTPALDRYGEVVLPRGAIVDHFMKNPVLLESHNYAMSSVGHVTELNVGEDSMTFEFVFSNDTRGQELEQKFVDGDMNAFSIGFRPKAKVDLWSPFDTDMPEVKEVKVMYPDGEEGVVDLSSYEHVPYRVYNQWELLEISPVAVPANPEALLMRQAEDIIRRVADPVMRSFMQEELSNKLAPIVKLLAEFNDSFDESEVRFEGAVPSHTTPIDEGPWSGSAAKAALAKWASGGSGKKEDINWAKYSKGFAWFDGKAADSLGAYKLPHHTIKDGALIAVWRGVTAAMAALLGARGGVDLDNKDAVYAHLAKHYRDFDKEPPEMKDYSEEELKAIEDEKLHVDPPASAEGDNLGGEGAIEGKATDGDEDGDGAADGDGDQEGQPTMKQVVEILNKILSVVVQLSNKAVESGETQEEHFMELLLRTEGIQDLLEYALQRKAVVKEKKVEPEVVAEVSADTIASLERIQKAL